MTAPRNIYLIGFSGTGKTQSGRMAAGLLGWAFADMDSLIEAREGRSIPQIFSAYGETHFRQLEHDLLRELAAKSDQVISTGGGVPIDPGNRELMAGSGIVVRLMASPLTIHRRIEDASGARGRALRPLLGSEAPVERITQLLADREPAYSTAHVSIDTEGKSHDQVAREIVAALQQASAQSERQNA